MNNEFSPISSAMPRQKFLNPQSIVEQAGISMGMNVVDFGCGAGDFAIALARAVGSEGQVKAIDIQDSALSSVRSKARIEGMLHINPVKGNLEVAGASGCDDASQDTVVLTNLLFQTKKREEVVREAFRIIKKEGMLVFVDWKKSAPLGPTRELRMEKESVRHLIEKEGFIYTRDIEAGAFHMGMIFVKRM